MLNMNEQKVYDLLDGLGVPYQVIRHPAVYTCEQAALYDSGAGAAQTKNLFLTNGDRSGFFLVVMAAEKKLKARELGRALGEKGLTFAPESDMLRLLGLTPGAVSPFGLVNDALGEVVLVLDNAAENWANVSFHPCVNTASVVMGGLDFIAMMRRFPNRLVRLDL